MLQSNSRFLIALGASLAVLVMAGCSEEAAEPVVDAAPPAVTEPAAPTPTPAPPVAENKPAEKPGEKEQKIQATAVSYEPPFPGRTDPFESPKQARSSVRTGEEGDDNDSVELNGFVLVDTPKAILSIDGQIVLLPAGGERYGVEVVSIDAPRVILQRGGTRWTVTLE